MKFLAKRIWGTALLALLASCTGGEDFSIDVARPAQRVMATFSDILMDDTFAADFPGLKIDFQRPNDHEVIYEVLNSPRGFTGIRLRFAAASDDSTVIHVSADLPASRNAFEGSEWVTEENFEKFLKIVLEKAARKLGQGQSVEDEREAFSKLLFQLALTADDHKLARALDMARAPELYGLDSSGEADKGTHGFSGSDGPDYSAAPEFSEAYDSHEASQPADDAQGDDGGASSE